MAHDAAHDALGNPLVDTAALDGINDFILGFLAYETRAEHILAAADAQRDAVLAQVYAGWLWMFLESPDAPAKARPWLLGARTALARRTPAQRASDAGQRELELVELLADWVDGRLLHAEQRAERIAERFPHDLATVKLAQYLAFNRGDSPAMLRLILAVLPAQPDHPHALGMAAFAYEQCHLLDDAEATARRALQLLPREPWAQHALAHVLLTRGRVDEGLAFLEAQRAGWTGLNSFMSTHLWWHLALFYIARGRDNAALAAYDDGVWGVSTSYSQDQVGAVQLLARLEWAGIDVGLRWQALAPFLATRAHDTVEPFLSLFYLYGLARAGRPEAETLHTAIAKAATEATPERHEAWNRAALPAATGLVALARHQPDVAREALASALPHLVHIGGSHAQRDLFALWAVDAAQRSGALLDAQQALEARRLSDPDDVAVNWRLAQLYAQLRLPQQALAAKARAERIAGPSGEPPAS